MSCGCHAAGCLRGAVGSSWPGPRLPAGRDGRAGAWRSERARALASFLSATTLLWASGWLRHPARHLAYREPPLSATWAQSPSRPTRAFSACRSRQTLEGLLRAWAGRQQFVNKETELRGSRLSPRTTVLSVAALDLEPGSALPSRDPGAPIPLDPSKPEWGGLGCWRLVSVHSGHTCFSAAMSWHRARCWG